MSSRRQDPAEEQNNPCTFDPEGDDVSHQWSVSDRPVQSRARMTPDGAVESTFEVDAVGAYEVTLAVRDRLQLAGLARLEVNAIPRDDLFVQLSWDAPESTPVDLDLHLLADAGQRIDGTEVTESSAATLFCEQDTFAFNPSPNLFDQASVLDDPRFLRDDQGTAGRLESTSLVVAPPGSEFRVAVHQWEGDAEAAPSLSIRVKGRSFLFSPETPLTGKGQVWVGAAIVFPEGDEEPYAIELDGRLTMEDFDGDVLGCF